ncbi:MAG: phosphoenolpyruvate carboxykinase (ATP) [Candidatus Eisenbacteria bacterium]
MDFRKTLDKAIAKHKRVHGNLKRSDVIGHVVKNKEAIVSANGALATWTPPESTGRAPKDTVIVKRPESAANIDWDSPNCIPLAPDTFEMLWQDGMKVLAKKPRIYYSDRCVGADPAYSLPIRTVSYFASTILFCDNMFLPLHRDMSKSIYNDRPFTLFVLPYDKIDTAKYQDRLRKLPTGGVSNMIVAMDFDRRAGLVYGSAYGGSCKKLVFTVMNYLLPGDGILPLHCSANEDKKGNSALLLGLSGTGKTTLSADPTRALLGDDEHGWSDTGVANFENGCYAKLIDLRIDKEPEIWHAAFDKKPVARHGALIENCMMYPNGTFDVDDDRLTPNSRVSYPRTFLSNIKKNPVGKHPKTILFLTADANGVLPPVAKLTPEQAMLWFLMGYTSKLAGTETGIVEPVSTFSRFFGAPFMPRLPDVYARMLGDQMAKHGTQVYLVNTGWNGGPYGQGSRMDILLTRKLVDAALSGKLNKVEYAEDRLFHIMVPKSVAGVPTDLLQAKNTWKDKKAFDERAEKLAKDFSNAFDKNYGNKGINKAVSAQCPGK